MSMNVKPVPALDNEINEIRLATAEIVNKEILPNEGRLWGAVSNSATMFSGGTPAWMLCTEANTKPLPGVNALRCARTSAATCAGVPRASVPWQSQLPPQNTSRSPNSAFNRRGSIPAAEVCTGFRMSKPQAMNSGMSGRTAPQECLKVFQHVWRWTQSLMRR